MVKQIAMRQGITERLKADDQMTWVSTMNHVRSIAEESVLNDLIYVLRHKQAEGLSISLTGMPN